MKKITLNIIKVLLILYLIMCGVMYFFQEKLIFFPEKLEQNYEFNYEHDFDELSFKATDGKVLNGLLFKTENSKGLRLGSFDQIRGIIDEEMEGVYNGSKTAQVALDSAVRRGNILLRRFERANK